MVKHPLCAAQAVFLTCLATSKGEYLVLAVASAMPGRRKRANSTAKAIIYHVYKYFECKEQVQMASKINM